MSFWLFTPIYPHLTPSFLSMCPWIINVSSCFTYMTVVNSCICAGSCRATFPVISLNVGFSGNFTNIISLDVVSKALLFMCLWPSKHNYNCFCKNSQSQYCWNLSSARELDLRCIGLGTSKSSTFLALVPCPPSHPLPKNKKQTTTKKNHPPLILSVIETENKTINLYYSYQRVMEGSENLSKYHPLCSLSFFPLSNFELNWSMAVKREKRGIVTAVPFLYPLTSKLALY